jgi:hypothetical protein
MIIFVLEVIQIDPLDLRNARRPCLSSSGNGRVGAPVIDIIVVERPAKD